MLWNLPSIIYAKLLFDFNILGSLCLLLRSKLWNLNLKNTISYLSYVVLRLYQRIHHQRCYSTNLNYYFYVLTT